MKPQSQKNTVDPMPAMPFSDADTIVNASEAQSFSSYFVYFCDTYLPADGNDSD